MKFLYFLTIFQAVVYAAPVIVYETVQNAPVYVTQYEDGASAGDADYSTDWSNAVSYLTTLWPTTSSTSDYVTVLPSTQEPAAVTTSSTPAATPSAVAATTSAVAATTSVVAATTSAGAVITSAVATTHSTTTSPEVVHTHSTTSVVAITPTTTSSTIVSSSTSVSGPKVTSLPKYMVYSPYNNDQSCKNAATVLSDLTEMKNKGIDRVRVYATDCNSLETVQPACKELGMRIVQGLWIGTSGLSNAWSQLYSFMDAADGDYSIYDSVIVGNEDVTNGYITADDLLSNVKSMRSILQQNGFDGDVIIAETTGAYLDNADALCDSSFPFIGLNAHSYFASSFSPQEAGTFVQDQIDLVKNACNGRSDIWISETGYPHKGDTNGLNVPTKQNQADAVNALLDTLNNDCVILAQFDDMWKSPGPYDVEQYFGVLDIIDA